MWKLVKIPGFFQEQLSGENPDGFGYKIRVLYEERMKRKGGKAVLVAAGKFLAAFVALVATVLSISWTLKRCTAPPPPVQIVSQPAPIMPASVTVGGLSGTKQ